jgi:eukaryotic-like serine/threonine-protein kinase
MIPHATLPRTFQPGDTFLHYEIVALLGEGFSGEVYKVRHLHTGACFALKVMHLADRGDARKVRRAMIEARGTYGIRHANVVSVLDLSCEANGMVWMLMELLEGESLSRLLGRQGRLSPLLALQIASEAAWGLDAAHEAQIIHRDVKPANLFLTTGGIVKVLDFSIAKVFPEGLTTTAGSAGLGTPAYMAPEQLEGAPADPRFDVYALGITLWQMLAGRSPLADVMDRQKELIRRQIRELPPSLESVAGLPAALDTLLAPALAKRPEARYVTMAALAQAITVTHAFLEREMAEGRMARIVVPGEPSVSTDPKGRSDYRSPVLVPEPDEPVHVTASRVVIAELPEDLVGTLPLGPREGVGGTMPLAARLPPPARGESPSLPSSREALSPTPIPISSLDSGGMATSELGVPSVPRRSTLSSRAAGLVLGAALVVTGGVIAWAGARRTPVVRQRPALPVAVAIEPTPTTSTTVPPAPPTTTIAMPPVATIDASAAPRSPASPSRPSASPKPTSAPAPTFTPLFDLPKK